MENQLTPNNSMVLEIRELLENARKNVAQQVNTQLLTTYWNIGRIIVEYEQQNQIRADYGKQTLRELSKELTREFGKGFSRSNLQNMRAFYLAYEKCQTVSGKLDNPDRASACSENSSARIPCRTPRSIPEIAA